MERRILRKIYGPKHVNRECGEWESMQNYSMYISHCDRNQNRKTGKSGACHQNGRYPRSKNSTPNPKLRLGDIGAGILGTLGTLGSLGTL
jgi:hypothetical protein